MGIHRYERGTTFRMKRAHLERKENGDIIAEYTPDKHKRFEYIFIGESKDTLTLNGQIINKHPKFKHIFAFEGWCMRYSAEHDT